MEGALGVKVYYHKDRMGCHHIDEKDSVALNEMEAVVFIQYDWDWDNLKPCLYPIGYEDEEWFFEKQDENVPYEDGWYLVGIDTWGAMIEAHEGV